MGLRLFRRSTDGGIGVGVARLPLSRRILYSGGISVLLLLGATLALVALEQWGLIDSYNQDDSVLYLQGRYLKVDAAWRHYQIMDSQSPRVVQSSFPIRKKKGTIRIAVTGESFVRGGHQLSKDAPPAGYGTLSDWMQQILEQRYPDQRFEVINAGANGQNSVRIRAVVKELSRVDLDILVVAMGNNEGVGPASPYSQELNDWILYRMLKKAVRSQPTGRPATSQPPTLNSVELERAFAANLDAIIAVSAENDLRLVLGTLPINLPNIAGFLQMEERQAILAAEPGCGVLDQLAQAHRCEDALAQFSSCTHTFFSAVRVASCLEEQGDDARAGELYAAAVEIEPRSRTRPSRNRLIRARAQERTLPLADLAVAMERRSRHGLSGTVDFIDHVHLTCMGYLPMARTIVDAIIAAGLIPGEALPDPSARALLQHYPWGRANTPPAVPSQWARQVCSADSNYSG